MVQRMQFVFAEIAAAMHLVLIGMLMIEQALICIESVTRMLVASVHQQNKDEKADKKHQVESVRPSAANMRMRRLPLARPHGKQHQ